MPAARTALEPLAAQLDSHTLGDLRLLVSELVTNSVRHSRSVASASIELDATIDRDTLRVEVADAGHGFEPRPRSSDQSQASGWGLYLVDRLTDRWGVDATPRGTRVWFDIDRSRREAAA